MTSSHSKKYIYAILLLTISYFIFELLFIPHAALVRDEFWFGHHIYQYTLHIPYRDFIPYKPTLGYYLLSLPFYFFHHQLIPLYYLKIEIAFINTLFLAGIGIWATRFFKPSAVFLTLLIILVNQLFLIISVDLRVDLLSSWLALTSALLILSNRPISAGSILGLAFLVSQKALWFLVASNAALLTYWILFQRNQQTFIELLKFNCTAASVIILYILFWSSLSDLHSVLNSMFYDGYIQSSITWYSSRYLGCWQAILSLGPLFFLIWPLTWLKVSNGFDDKKSLFIAVYSTVMLMQIVSYQQPFLYNMVFCLPGFFIAYCEFFSWIFTIKNFTSTFSVNRLQFYIYTLTYLIIVAVIFVVKLSNVYYMIAIIPICLSLFFNSRHHIYTSVYFSLILLTIIFTGIIYPITVMIGNVYSYIFCGDYQKTTINIANKLLAEGGEYFAGTPVLYQKEQAIDGLKNLIGPQLEYIENPSLQILPILIASLDLAPKNPQEILQDLKSKPIKLYINNNRIEALPANIQEYLKSQYQHFWGSVYLYAPEVLADQNSISIKFDGEYKVHTEASGKIYIDNQVINPNTTIKLTSGNHQTNTSVKYRLIYIPKNKTPLLQDQKYQQYRWEPLGSI